MDHAAVVAGLVGGQAVFGFEDDELEAGTGLDQGHGGGGADNAAADDGNIIGVGWHAKFSSGEG
jgi:hypothetical protein